MESTRFVSLSFSCLCLPSLALGFFGCVFATRLFAPRSRAAPTAIYVYARCTSGACFFAPMDVGFTDLSPEEFRMFNVGFSDRTLCVCRYTYICMYICVDVSRDLHLLFLPSAWLCLCLLGCFWFFECLRATCLWDVFALITGFTSRDFLSYRNIYWWVEVSFTYVLYWNVFFLISLAWYNTVDSRIVINHFLKAPSIIINDGNAKSSGLLMNYNINMLEFFFYLVTWRGY